MRPGLVSVIVPTHNRVHLLQETLASAQLQSYANLEILVVDDASTDGTEELVTRIAATDGRIQFARLPRQSGAPVARNQALAICEGEFVQFLDSDDVLHPEKLRVQVDLLNAHLENDLAACQTGMFVRKPGDNQILWNRLMGDAYLRHIQHDMPWVTVGPLWRKSLLDRVGGHNETLPSSQDYEHATRAMILGAKPLLHRHLLSFYRVHETGSIGRASAPFREEVHFRVFKMIRDLLKEQGQLTCQLKDELAQNFFWVAGRAANFGKGPVVEEAFSCALELSQVDERESKAKRILEELRATSFRGPEFTPETYAELQVDLAPRDWWWGRYAFYEEPPEPIPAARRYRRS